ncbi:hypothetical protein SERLADRAFT_391588 [Serpula lacrymans var. lacrymans S7.9]|uniref:Uncharacterized protein n=1 Tax=Serpula lacrymans var. lacrymans (strain S7.9) TaxID=578457 RepID=F8P0G8_SERL9|nr:uncharacterized protein SERLADRAFT_391588 [Serpula lacrymans var. lacrymans S7.9]EGO23523.1 hypothetical protein SERLADRAFT_391588 [Serpula lacrymans var. lacrymans S7.9]
MTEEEIETERKDIVERFGTGVGDLLKTVEEAMERRLQGQLQGFSPFESLSLRLPYLNLSIQLRWAPRKHPLYDIKEPHAILLSHLTSSIRPPSRSRRLSLLPILSLSSIPRSRYVKWTLSRLVPGKEDTDLATIRFEGENVLCI